MILLKIIFIEIILLFFEDNFAHKKNHGKNDTHSIQYTSGGYLFTQPGVVLVIIM